MATNDKKKLTASRRISKLLGKAIDNFEQRVTGKEAFSPSIAEYLKLMQMQKELDDADEQEAKEIKVTWVDPEGAENSE